MQHVHPHKYAECSGCGAPISKSQAEGTGMCKSCLMHTDIGSAIKKYMVKKKANDARRRTSLRVNRDGVWRI